MGLRFLPIANKRNLQEQDLANSKGLEDGEARSFFQMNMQALLVGDLKREKEGNEISSPMQLKENDRWERGAS